MNILRRVCCSVLAMTASTMAHQFRLANSGTEAKLPKPMSDMSAVVGPDDLIYIAGGCDSPFGSQYNDEVKGFRCSSVSDSFFAFNPETQDFIDLPPMPEPRYRHAAVAINNQIWLVGGRDADDQLVGNIHVYDLEDMRWRTFRDLHPSYWLSDLGGFSARGRAHFVGGFTDEYRAVRKVWSIDPERAWEEGELRNSILRHANLVHRRGDVGVTVDSQERFAYVSGGSSHANSFCSPLSSVEQYDLIFNHWLEVAPLTQERTGKTVYSIDDQLVALGGAQQIRKLCNKTSTNDPSDMQTPVYEVEVFDDQEWSVVGHLSEYRFRSTSVVFNGTVYSFGGQSVFFSVCMCHPTVDQIVTYKQAPLAPAEQPGGLWASTNNYQANFPGQAEQPAQVEEAEPPQDMYNQYEESPEYYPPPVDQYDESPEYNQPPGGDYLESPELYQTPYQETVEEAEGIQERGIYGQDEYEEEYKDELEQGPSGYGSSTSESTQTGFGGYHRDKSNGFGSESNTIAPTGYFFTAIIAVIAAIVL